MKLKITMILFAAMLAVTGCELREADPGETGKTSETELSETQKTTEAETPAPETAEPDYKEVYKPVLDAFYKLASCGYDLSSEDFDDSVLPQGSMGILEGNGFGSSDKMLWDAGYMLRDLSGDGIPELLIGSMTDEAYEGYRTMIYALYTCADGQPQFVLEGAYRNAYYLMDDGAIFNQGSAGAAYSIFGIYDLSADGTSLNCRDCWFTYEKDGNFEDIRPWHNTTGEMNPNVSEELDMTLDDLWAKDAELSERTVVLELTAFAEYSGVENPAVGSTDTGE